MGNPILGNGLPPVVILGMHRSGTTLLGDFLERLGLYQGAYHEKNNEARLFLALNRWILSQTGADWDHPEPALRLGGHPGVLDSMEDYVRRALSGPKAAGFLGPLRFLSTGSVLRLRTPWGWKDPRTTITWPVWSRVFPEARVIHVLRHGVDVAASLRARQAYRADRMRRHYERRRWAYGVLPRRKELADTLRCSDVEEGLALWDLYARQGRRIVEDAGPCGLEIRYEDLLSRPMEILTQAAEFAGLDVSGDKVAEVAAVDDSRSRAYLQHPDLVALAERRQALLRPFGYS